MKTFAIGKVVDPAVRTTDSGKQIASFGLLVGQQSEAHQVFRNDEGKGSNKVFDFCSGLKDGDTIIVICGFGVSQKGQLRTYINDVRHCPPDLRKSLSAVFAEGKPDGK